MDDSLAQRGRSLEEMFFRQRDAELIEQRKKLEAMQQNKQALAEASGITNTQALDKLAELQVSPSTLAALVILPLVEVAWADGHLDDKERHAVLEAAAKRGIKKGSLDYGLLESWLKEKPSAQFLEAWVHYIQGFCESLSQSEREVFKSELLTRARGVAESAGGLFNKVSPQEKQILKQMEDAFQK